MGEFRRIEGLAAVHVEPILAERCAAVLGSGWQKAQLAGEAWAYVDGAVARGIGGLEPIWPGRLALWSYTGTLTAGDWKRVLRFTRLRLARAIEVPGTNRIEATALLDDPKYAGFLSRLGLKVEGRLCGYTPQGQAVDLFSMIPERVA